jgi:hypothetical protein
MHTFSITLPASITVESRDVIETLDCGKLIADIVTRGAIDGLCEAIRDAASGAAKAAASDNFGDKVNMQSEKVKDWLKTPDGTAAIALHTGAMMAKKARAIESGEWTMRRTGNSAGIRGIALVRLFRAIMPDDVRKRFAKLSASEQVAKAIDNADKFAEDLIEAKIAEIEAERAAELLRKNAERESLAAIAEKVKFDF